MKNYKLRYVYVAILFAFSFLFSISSCSTTTPSPGRKEYNEGVVLHRQKKFEEAITLYKKALELNGDHVNAAYNIGAIYYELNDYDNSVEYLKKALSINSKHNNSNYLLAAIHLSRKNYQDTYRHIINTTGKDKADFFKSFVSILVKEGYRFESSLSLLKNSTIEPFPKNNFKWTEWDEKNINFEAFVSSSGEIGERTVFWGRNSDKEYSDYVLNLIKNLNFKSVETGNGKEFSYHVEGRVYVDSVETEIVVKNTTFEEIMDKNLISILDPSINLCWFIAAVDNIGTRGEIKTELTVNPDGTIKKWKTVDRYQAPVSVSKCIGKKLKGLTLNNFPGKKRKLVHISSF